MCNLYAMTKKDDDLGRFFRVSHNRRAAFQLVNAIFPRHVAPVVRQSEDGEREIALMSWGFLRLEKGRAPKPVTNVRDDQSRTNPFWRDSFAKRRCLVPASSFCEPNPQPAAAYKAGGTGYKAFHGGSASVHSSLLTSDIS